MGVSIHPGGASWSYGGFNRFRTRLAAEEGIDLDKMRGFGGAREWETSNGNHISPLVPLLNHSDCDGHLESYDCEEVAPRLRLILDRWEGRGGFETEYDVQHGRLLLDAMEHSVAHGCAVVFG